jgi:ADP-heptose:LPS heptosyltransferase
MEPFALAAAERFDVYSLQRPDLNVDLPGCILKPPIEDLDTLAGMIQSMDLVITVDSAPAHIAGALGIPCRLLIPPNNDWRWQRNCSETLWYPFMRVYQAKRPKQWGQVLEEAFTITKAELIGDFIA